MRLGKFAVSQAVWFFTELKLPTIKQQDKQGGSWEEEKEGQEQDEMEEGGAFFPKSQTLTSQARLLPCPGFSLLHKLTRRISLSWPTKCRDMGVLQRPNKSY